MLAKCKSSSGGGIVKSLSFAIVMVLGAVEVVPLPERFPLAFDVARPSLLVSSAAGNWLYTQDKSLRQNMHAARMTRISLPGLAPIPLKISYQIR